MDINDYISSDSYQLEKVRNTRMKTIEDVMKELTRLKNISDGHDIFDIRLKAIAETLDVFRIEWSFVEENGRFIAKLKQSNR